MSLLTQILQSRWAVSPEFARAIHPAVTSLIEGRSPEWGYPKPQAGQAFILPGSNSREAVSSGEEIPHGSILIIDLKGPMMRDNQLCGPEGTQSIAERIRIAGEAEEVSAIILEVNSPGGQIDGTEELADAIAQCQKPTYALCHNAASAAYWAASHAKEVWMGSKTAMAGSIGVFCSFTDVRGAWEKAGVKIHEIYARTSPAKNRAFKSALEGDYDEMQDQLDDFDRIFMQAVKSRRKGIAGEALKGGMFTAQRAVELGLADRIGGLQELIRYIRSSNHSSNTSILMSEEKKIGLLGKFQALFGSEEKLSELNGEIASVQQELKTAQARIRELEGSNASIASELEQARKERDDWKAKAEAYGSQPGAVPTEPASPKADAQGEPKAPPYFDAEASHNRIL